MTDKPKAPEKAATSKATADTKAKADTETQADTETKADTKAKPAPVTPLPRASVRLSRQRFQHHAVTVPAKHGPDAALNSKYWENNAAQLHPGDEIRVLADDYSFVQTVIVTYKSGSAVAVERLSLVELADAALAADGERFVVRPGARGGFVIQDQDTGEYVGGNYPNRSTAERQKEDHINALKL